MLSEAPEGWVVVPLPSICRPKQHPTIPKAKFTKTGYPVFGANGQIGFYDNYTHENKTIAITCRGATCGTINIAPPQCYITGNAMALDGLQEDRVTFDFLNQYLRYSGVDKAITGSAQPQITGASLKSISILIPPLAEQERIAEILTSVDDSIRATERVIKQAERVKRGLMEELLTGGLGSAAVERGEVPAGWDGYSIGEVCNVGRGGSPRPIEKFMTDEDDGINWIKIGDASASSKYIYNVKEKIKKEGMQKSRFVKSGDFLLSNSMSFGRPYILRTDGCIHDGWLVLSASNAPYDVEYFYYLLSSPIVFQQFERAAAGSAVKNLNKELVSNVRIVLPNIETQNEISAKLSIIDEVVLINGKQRMQLTKLKQGLMDDLLTGKVRTV